MTLKAAKLPEMLTDRLRQNNQCWTGNLAYRAFSRQADTLLGLYKALFSRVLGDPVIRASVNALASSGLTDEAQMRQQGQRPLPQYLIDMSVLPQISCHSPTSIVSMPEQGCKQPSLSPRKSTLIHRGPPKRYRLLTERKIIDENDKIRKWTYGIKDTSKQNKIVVLVGETGTGKTTLINTMVNYLLGVKFEDEIWYEITEEAARDQSESQTSEITMYEVFPVKSPMSLTIIDTPGYGDTRGLEKDLEVAENLATLFQSKDGVHEVDAVYIVNNIVFLITHSDGLPPKNVLGGINKAEIPCRRDTSGQPVYFLFNNHQGEGRHTKERYIRAQRDAWDDSMDDMKHFFQSLDEKNRRSLELTSNILEAIRINKEKIEQSKNFAIEVKKTVKQKVPIESKSWKHRKATTCTVCEENCHEFDCWWASGPSKCEVMKNGYCTVCTGNCHYSKHVKENKKYAITNSSMRMEFDDLKKEYEKAQKESKRFSVIMDHLEKDLKEIENKKSIFLTLAYQTIKHLSQIALKPDSAFTLQHLDFFIPRVREAGNEEWVRELEEMKRKAVADEANKDALSYLKAGLGKLFFSVQ
ncbi:Septin-14 [Labeo rohita]|uniref:Septin-14 n=1 Tax=Labeo rohita TaxID=84645 RepID=A0ABQ8MJI2_LABRO|nr:Septin-14 [Labeo rohita]